MLEDNIIVKGGFTINRQFCPNGSVPYIVRNGDTLTQIARIYQTDINDIIYANPGINPNNLRVGQSICIPLSIQYYPSCPTTNYYVVRRNDTFTSIARYFNITQQQLLNANYGIDPDNLYEDQILCIPVATPVVRILINKNNNNLSVYQNGDMIRNYPFKVRNEIPTGNFIILFKNVDPGEKYGARYLGLSAVNLGIHGESLGLYPNLVGIQLTNENIIELFNLTTVGTEVVIK